MAWKIFLIFIFLFEVFDASSRFVRTGVSHHSVEYFGASVFGSSHTGKEPTAHHKVHLDVSSHAALPVLQVPMFVVLQFESILDLPDVIIPRLNPPISLLKRPPKIS